MIRLTLTSVSGIFKNKDSLTIEYSKYLKRRLESVNMTYDAFCYICG